MARELYAYKDERTTPRQREQKTVGLAAVLWKWLAQHESCVAATAGVRAFDTVTSVPSTSGRPRHPLPWLISRIVDGSEQRYRDLLVVNRTDSHSANRPLTVTWHTSNSPVSACW